MSFIILRTGRTDTLPTSCSCSSARARGRLHLVLMLECPFSCSSARARARARVLSCSCVLVRARACPCFLRMIGPSKPFRLFALFFVCSCKIVRQGQFFPPNSKSYFIWLNSKPCWDKAASASAVPPPPPAIVRIRSSSTN